MRLLIAPLITLILNGCVNNDPELPHIEITPKYDCAYPTLPTYKTPATRSISKPLPMNNGMCLMPIADVLEMNNNILELRGICWKYASVAIKTNNEMKKRKEPKKHDRHKND